MCNYEEFLEQYGDYLDELIKLQYLLLDSFQSDKPLTSISQIPPKFYQTKPMLSHLLSFITTGINTRHQYKDLYYSILEELIPYLKKFETEKSLYYISIFNSIKLWFYQHDLISFQTIVTEVLPYHNRSIYFLPEIIENDPSLLNDQMIKDNPYVPIYLKFDIEEFKRLRKQGFNHTEIAKAIRTDDIREFQIIISNCNTPINSLIPFSAFENFPLSCNTDEMPTLIEYAAFFCSQQVFKFLVMNNAKLTNNTFEFAVYGGSYEIIHILEEKHCPNDTALAAAVRFCRNEVVEYLVESAGILHTPDSILRSIHNYNIKVFKDVLPLLCQDISMCNSRGENALTIAICQDFPELAKMILNIKGVSPTMEDNNQMNGLFAACQSGNMEMVKLFVEKYKVDLYKKNIEGVFAIFIKIGESSILNYILKI